MGKKEMIETGLEYLTKFASDESIQKLLFGSYSDGKPRSIQDAMRDEIYSPEQKKNKAKNDKKKKKKEKKKKKHKKAKKHDFYIEF